jgi:hypothetical protein
MEITEKLEFIRTLAAIGMALPTIMQALINFEGESSAMGKSILSAMEAAEQSAGAPTAANPIVENPIVS